MEDLAAYNDGCKAVSLLITILANVVIFRLLTRDALGIGSTHTHTHTHIHLVIQGRPRVSNRYITTFASMVISRLTALQPWL